MPPASRTRPGPAFSPTPAALLLSLLLALVAGLIPGTVRGAAPTEPNVQFDVFVGFDDTIRDGHWFPIAFEITNEGPTFTGMVLVGPEDALDSDLQSFPIELPTNTRKRMVIPVFPRASQNSRWDAQLIGPDGTVIADRTAIRPRINNVQAPVIGALPRSFGGLPTLPEIPSHLSSLPVMRRLQPDYLPDNPLALDGLGAFVLNSHRAVDIKAPQVDALLTWINGGGHLIVLVEQATDISGSPWLQGIVPWVPEALVNVRSTGALERWVVEGPAPLRLQGQVLHGGSRRRSVPNTGEALTVPADPLAELVPDTAFNAATLPLFTGRQVDGTVLVREGDHPLVITVPRGLGTVTVVAFSNEAEPYRTWKNREWFWVRVTALNPTQFQENVRFTWTSIGLDGVVGAMLDSRQVRKLPVGALLLILVVYLLVIGPFDRWILQRTGRQMWTWITFPAYVVLFSALIYFIGYRLRAGDLEWNELQVIDQLPKGEEAVYRGRTWASLYSPSNNRYRFASEQPFATFRGEFQPSSGGLGSGSFGVRHPARGFTAEASVPVWVNQMFSSDWVQPGPVLLQAQVQRSGDQLDIQLDNPSSLPFTELQLIYGERRFRLGGLGAGKSFSQQIPLGNGDPLLQVYGTINQLVFTAQQRRQAFGGEGSGILDRSLDHLIAASLSDFVMPDNAGVGDGIALPSTFDIAAVLDRGQAVLFGWAANQSVAAPIHRFSPGRQQRDVVVRTAIPVSVTP